MAEVGSILSKYASASELSALLESDKFGIYAADTYLALDGVVDDYSALYALINTTINGDDAEIWFKDGTCLIGTSITIPANVKLKFLNGGMLKPESGVVITGARARIEAGLYQIFDLSASGTTGLAGTWMTEKAYPQWFGAVGDGTTVDKTAFDNLFAFCDTTKVKAYIPKATYNIATPLATIGSNNIASTELGDFVIEGECMHDTILLFNLASDSDVAFKLETNSSGWDISNFRLKNTSGDGIGFYFDSIYKSTIKNLQAFNFDVGFKKQAYISTFSNLNGTNCKCGFYDLGGTSTLNISCYAANNALPGGDVRDFAGCGYFIAASDYNKYISCASDSNEYAYKIKTSTASYGGTEDTIEFDNCGNEGNAYSYYFDGKGLEASIRRPTTYGTTSNRLLDVINAVSVVISDYADNNKGVITLGSNVGVGVVRFANSSWQTGGNPANYPAAANVTTYDNGIYGINDFNYDGIRYDANYYFTNGKMTKLANSIEFKLYARSNGGTACAKVDIIPCINYSGGALDRGGSVYIGLFNDTNVIYANSTKTNSGFKVTVTKITSGPNEIGATILVEPFDSTTNPTLHKAIINVEVFANPLESGNGKNHNIKLAGTYSGRSNVLLNGVDY